MATRYDEFGNPLQGLTYRGSKAGTNVKAPSTYGDTNPAHLKYANYTSTPTAQVIQQAPVLHSQAYGPSATPYNYGMSQEAIDSGVWKTPATEPGMFDGFGQGLAGAWDTIGGAKGFADIGGGLASMYGIYQGIQQNKRAEEAFRMQKAEYNRGVKKDKDFGDAVNRSGLGSYSAGA
jgi:hypothetical protein